MPVPVEFLRAVLALLAVLFGFMLGRAAARVRQGGGRRSALYGWLIRTVLTAFAASWRHGLDLLVVVLLALTTAAVAAGAWRQSRPREPEEDLTRQIFPE